VIEEGAFWRRSWAVAISARRQHCSAQQFPLQHAIRLRAQGYDLFETFNICWVLSSLL
jgi:hypothetical protein